MLAAFSESENDEKAVNSAMQELRGEVEEVRAELNALNRSNEKWYRLTLGGIAVAVSIFGFQSIVPPVAAIPSLITLLGLIHKSGQDVDKETARLRSKPAYVLMKAQEHGGH